jgi:hypothetical protein
VLDPALLCSRQLARSLVLRRLDDDDADDLAVAPDCTARRVVEPTAA